MATHYYLGIFFSLGIVSLAFQFLRGLCLLYGSLNAAQNLHTNLVGNVRSPGPPPSNIYHEAGCGLVTKCQYEASILSLTHQGCRTTCKSLR